MIRTNLSTCFAVALYVGSILGAERSIEVIADYIEIYAAPTDTISPFKMARKGKQYRVFYSHADDSGRIWFCIEVTPKAGDTAWVFASGLKYVRDAEMLNGKASVGRLGADKNEMKRRYAVLRKHRDWPRRIKQAVRNGEVVLNMSKEQVIGAWGKPQRSGMAFMLGVGKYEIFYYLKAGDSPPVIVTFENSCVTGWSEK